MFEWLRKIFKKEEPSVKIRIESGAKRERGFIEKPAPKYPGYCEYCKKTKMEWSDIFLCHYCNEFHCANHRLPESHECTGEPISPSNLFNRGWNESPKPKEKSKTRKNWCGTPRRKKELQKAQKKQERRKKLRKKKIR